MSYRRIRYCFNNNMLSCPFVLFSLLYSRSVFTILKTLLLMYFVALYSINNFQFRPYIGRLHMIVYVLVLEVSINILISGAGVSDNKL